MNPVLDLFPLATTVLFPHQEIPLNIFEPRYLNLIEQCTQQNKGFGISLIKEGAEVGPPPIPHKVGTAVEIISYDRIEKNRFFVVVRGTRRFQIVRLLQEQPHIRVEISWLDPEEDNLFPGDYELLRHTLKRLLEKIPTGRDLQEKLRLADQEELFALTGIFLSGNPFAKQKILEQPREDFIPTLQGLFESLLE